MLTAKLGNNTINCYSGEYSRESLKEWDKKNILLCSVCNKPYRYHHGKIISPYFQHKNKQECLYEYYEPETEEHIKGKIALYEWVKSLDSVTDIILEGWIPETKQRPDIMFKYNEKQYVIEYQCCPIASEYLERHELYQAAGIYDIWILGIENYKITIQDKGIKSLLTKRAIYHDNVTFLNSKTKYFLLNQKIIYYTMSMMIWNFIN